MATTTLQVSTEQLERIAQQINDIHKKMQIVENFYLDVLPGMQKMSKEINDTVSDLRVKFERDETLQLLKKVGDNLPNFLKLMDAMEGFMGFFEDTSHSSHALMKEITPTVNSLRYVFERDETVELLQKTGESIPTFIKLLNFLAHFDNSGDLDFTLRTAFAKETEYMMRGMEKCAVRTMQQLMEKPLKAGMKSLFSAFMDPEVQKGFVLMTTFARNMPQCMLETIEESEAAMKKNK